MDNLDFSNAPILPTVLLVGFVLYFLYGVVKHIQFTRENVKISRDLLNSVEELEQIKQDDYGWCDACGDEIGIKRLEARPTATHCIHCKTLDEIKEKQLSG